MADPRYPTAIAAELADDVLERFLRYLQVDTQSDEDSDTYPSTAKQLDLGKMLAEELREIALPVVRDEVDYTKANRLFTGEAWNLIPHNRLLCEAHDFAYAKRTTLLSRRPRLCFWRRPPLCFWEGHDFSRADTNARTSGFSR